MDSLRKRVLRLKKGIKKAKKTLKGSSKDPFFCLGAAAVFLFLFVSLAAGPINNAAGNSLAFIVQPFQEKEGEVFLGLAQKSWLGSPEFLLVANNSLKTSSPPTTFSPQVLGALVAGYEPEDTKKVIVEYLVEPGDSLSGIASYFGISLNTLLWANDLNKNTYLQPGQKLIIPPTTGVIHHVKSGDTISLIAQTYKAKTSEILAFNNLSDEGDIFIGDIVIVPQGVIPAPSIQTAPQYVPLADSYFICPISAPCRITQGLHWYNAIDFSHGKCGEPIFAAAAGTVLKVKLTSSTSRWAFGGAGNHLTILHPNGAVTIYGHIANSFVNSGDHVSQGQVIALMGGQPGTAGAGLSTGCHLHFGVSGARNPFAQ